MRINFIFAIFFIFCKGHSQSDIIENWVKNVNNLKDNNELVLRTIPNKTFVGSLTGYYYEDSLVLINSLKDGEYGGTEFLYYIKDNVLLKVMIMEARFSEHKEWEVYYQKHIRNKNCELCHETLNCKKTEIKFESIPNLIQTPNTTLLNEEQSNKIINDVKQIYNKLLIMLN